MAQTPQLEKEHFVAVDNMFYKKAAPLLGCKSLQDSTQVRRFGVRCMLLGVVLLPVTLLTMYVADLIGVRGDGLANILSYPVFILMMLSPYAFFVGLDCLISGKIWQADERPRSLSALNIVAAVLFLVSAFVSLGYFTYYQQVYLPWQQGRAKIMQEFGEKFGSSFASEELLKSSSARRKIENMSYAPKVCGALWGMTFLMYAAYFLHLKSKLLKNYYKE